MSTGPPRGTLCGTRRELFVDDYLIDRMDRVRLEIQKPESREDETL